MADSACNGETPEAGGDRPGVAGSRCLTGGIGIYPAREDLPCLDEEGRIYSLETGRIETNGHTHGT